MLNVLTSESKSFAPIVSAHGYGDANIMFLSGFPSKDDIRNGVALSGYAETTLSSLMRAAKLDLKKAYRNCFIKQELEYSGTNPKKLSKALAKIDVEAYKNLLFSDIKDVNPNIVVPLDDIALSAVFPHINAIKKPKGRTHWVYCYRGSSLPLRDDFARDLPNVIRIIPSLHPQILNQDYSARAYVQIDFQRLAQFQNHRNAIENYGNIWIARDYRSLSNFFERGLQENDGFVTFDIETFYGMITCISFCFNGVEAVSVPLSPYFYPEISKGELALIWQLVGKLLKHDIPKNNQNIKFDWIILLRHGFVVNNVIHDTMLKGALLYPELPKGLDFYTSIWTPISYYKDEGKEFDPRKDNKDKLLFYNAKDSLAAHIINVEEDKELEENGQKNLYYNEIAPLLLIYKNIDETGISVDDEQKTRLLYKYTGMFERNRDILRGLVNNPDFNPNSPQQVGRLVYEELKFPKRTKTNEHGIKGYRTDKETLDDLLINYGEQNAQGFYGCNILRRQILCRKLAKVIETIKTPLYPDNTFRGSSNLAGTETGRSSFSKALDERFYTETELAERKANKKAYAIKYRLGRSLQTISKHGFKVDDEVYDDFEAAEIAHDLRSMLVPRRGYCFVEGDGSGAEARFVFVLAEDWDGLASMDQKPKIHAKTAALCFGIDVNLIRKDEHGQWTPSIPKIGMTYYDGGKRIRHAGNYRMEEFRLAQMTHMSLSDCKVALNRFHASNPKIRSVFHADIDKAIQKYKALETPFKRKRQFFDRISNKLYKEATAQIPQSTISDQTKFTMPRIIEQLSGYGSKYRFLTEQHDGILAEVLIDYKMEYAEAFKRIYERPIDCRIGSLSRDFDLVIPAEMSASEENWMNLMDIHL